MFLTIFLDDPRLARAASHLNDPSTLRTRLQALFLTWPQWWIASRGIFGGGGVSIQTQPVQRKNAQCNQ